MASRMQITYYDFTNLYYSGYFIDGFWSLRKSYKYDLKITKQIPSELLGKEFPDEWRDVLFSICLFSVSNRNETFYFCIDTRDGNSADVVSRGYCLPLLDKVKFYFKVNYSPAIIESDPFLRRYSEIIRGVPLFFPVQVPNRLLFLPRLRPCPAIQWGRQQTKYRLAHLLQAPSLDEIYNLRNINKDIDIFFITSYYVEKEHAENNRLRLEIIKLLKKNTRISTLVGMTDVPKDASEYQPFALERMTLHDYLRALARAKIAIYVRGLHDCVSFKLGQYFALGKVVVGQRVINNSSDFYAHPDFERQFAFDEPQDIVAKSEELLNQPEELNRLSESNRDRYDVYWTPSAIADVALKAVLSEIEISE
jgi:hypothetical protein